MVKALNCGRVVGGVVGGGRGDVVVAGIGEGVGERPTCRVYGRRSRNANERGLAEGFD